MPATFPWLSNEAAGWEKYRFNSMKFCYYTRTGTSTPGSFMMAPDYDAADQAPLSEVAASAYDDTVEDAPWKDSCCVLPGSKLMGDMKERYVRGGQLAANLDIKTYDCGNLFACTVDGTAVIWGKLWVEYDVTLITPHVPPGGFQSTGTLTDGGGGLVTGKPFGNAPLSTGTIGLTANTNIVTITNVQIGQEICVSSFVTGTGLSAFSLGSTGLTAETTAAAVSASVAVFFATFTVTTLNPTLTYNITGTTVVETAAVVSVLSPQPDF